MTDPCTSNAAATTSQDEPDTLVTEDPIEELSTEDLIEEVSIDGMCGVY